MPSRRWKRTPSARVFWGADLQSAGWNFTWVQDTPTDMSHSLANKARFKRMVTEEGGSAAVYRVPGGGVVVGEQAKAKAEAAASRSALILPLRTRAYRTQG